MACWICTFGSACSSILEPKRAMRYFQPLTNGFAIVRVLSRRRLPRVGLPDQSWQPAATPSHRTPGAPDHGHAGARVGRFADRESADQDRLGLALPGRDELRR